MVRKMVWFTVSKEGESCQNGREQLISQLDVLDTNLIDLITDSDVDEADNAVFWKRDDEIIDVDI